MSNNIVVRNGWPTEMDKQLEQMNDGLPSNLNKITTVPILCCKRNMSIPE